jgi:hypothetical protein
MLAVLALLVVSVGVTVCAVAANPVRNNSSSSSSTVLTGKGAPTVQLVVARYGEDVSWLLTDRRLQQYVSTAIIYNKGDGDIPEAVANAVQAVVVLPNVGKCDHTYLHHIVRGLRGDIFLANNTIFIPGSVLGEPRKADALRACLREAGAGVGTGNVSTFRMPTAFEHFQLLQWKTSFAPNASKNSEETLLPAPIRPFGPWFRSVFGNVQTQAPFYHGGCFSGRKEVIERTPLTTYETLLRQCAAHSNPEVGHYIERVWGFLMTRAE